MHQPIGLFDSGFGGLTVMKEIARLLPHESLIYLGDTAHLPYGNKSPETVLQYALENAQFLLKKNIKLLVIPCHTACSHALQTLQASLPIPVIGVIEPGLCLVKSIPRIAVLATTSTIESGIYQTLIQKQNPQALVYAKACPLFVPLIEEGFYAHPSADLIATAYLESLKGQIDAALLACTHYPLLRPLIQKALGPDIQLFEPAALCAQQTLNLLKEKNLLNISSAPSSHTFYVTDDPEKFRRFGQIFFGSPLEKVEKI